MATLRIPLRQSGVALGFSGAAWAIATPLHPTILQGDVAGVVRRTEGLELIHILLMVGSVAAVLGAAGIVAAHEGTLGRRGDTVLAVTIVGAIVTASIMLIEAFMLPTLAIRDPGLLELDGPLLVLVGIRIVIVLGGAYPVGLLLLGALTSRADLAPDAGRALVVSTIAFLALALPFVPVVGVLAGVAFAAAHVWWGWVLWHHEDRSRSPVLAEQPGR